MSALGVHEHGKHTVDGTFSTIILGLRPASPDDRLRRGSVNAPPPRPVGVFVARALAAWIDASRPRRTSGRPARAPTDVKNPPQPSVFASFGGGGGGRPSVWPNLRRVDAGQIAHEFHLFLRGLLFGRDFRISLLLKFCLDRILSLAKIHTSKNTPRAPASVSGKRTE